MERSVCRRTCSDPVASTSTTPFSPATWPMRRPSISTAAPAVRPETLPSKIAIRFSSGPSARLNTLERAWSGLSKTSNTCSSDASGAPETKVSKVTPPASSELRLSKSTAAPPVPTEKEKPEVSQNRVSSVTRAS